MQGNQKSRCSGTNSCLPTGGSLATGITFIALNTGACAAICGRLKTMRMLSKNQVKELVLYSPQHIARLEKAGEFPKRVKLGANRVGWVEQEVLDWLEERLDARD